MILALIATLALPLYGQQQARVLPYDVLLRSAIINLGLKPAEYDKAWNLLKQAVDNYPDALEAHYLMGTICSDRAQYKEMVEHFKTVEQICNKESMDADKKLKKRCEKDQMPEQMRNIRMSALKKSFSEGVANLKNADSIGRALPTVTDDSLKAKQLVQVNVLLAKAKSVFEECLIIDDTVAIVWTNLGTVESKMNNSKAAVEYYLKSYQLNPKDKDLYFPLASALFQEKDYEKAAKFYGEYADEDSSGAEPALINQAMCFQAMKDDELLLGSLTKIMNINPKNADVAYQRGIYFIRKAASLQDSTLRLDSLSEIRPNDKALEKAKAELIADRVGFYEKALPDFKLAAEETQTDPEYWYWYGNAALLSNKVDEARTAYDKCVANKDDQKDCWCQLRTIYAKLNLLKEFEAAEKKCAGAK
jgi:tetratricopeptide (TPR) repeat protein